MQRIKKKEITMAEINVNDEVKKLRQLYKESKTSGTFNAIVYGDIGTGKTNIVRTARQPVLIHSFDPGGTKTVRDEIDKGNIIADTRYENEDAKSPTAFAAWEKEFDRLRRTKFFESIGTFVIDSATTWSDAMMNEILKRGGRQGTIPQIQDYLVQQNTIRDTIKAFTNLPCDCILTGHISLDKDEVSGRMHSSIMVAGKSAIKMPLLFDEIYVAVSKNTAKGVEYKLITRNDGVYKARTRLGKGDVFETYEEPDIKALLKKSGLSCEDKPSIK